MLSFQLTESEISELQQELAPHLIKAQTKAKQCKTFGVLSVGLLGVGSYSVNALVQFLNAAESKLQDTTNLFYNLTCSEIAPLNKISYHCQVLANYNNSALVTDCAEICNKLDTQSFWVWGAGLGLFFGLYGGFVFCWWLKSKTNFLTLDHATGALYAPTQATPVEIRTRLTQRHPDLAEETDIFVFSSKLKQQLTLFRPIAQENKDDMKHEVNLSDLREAREEQETLLGMKRRGYFGRMPCVIL